MTFSASFKKGGCWVHHWCAVWSDGVKQHENDKLENVDKAVISGIPRVSKLLKFGNSKSRWYVLETRNPNCITLQLCEHCKRLGATIRCHAEGCLRFYHFPCSAASGSFQSMKQLLLLCPEHIDKAKELGKQLLHRFRIVHSFFLPHNSVWSKKRWMFHKRFFFFYILFFLLKCCSRWRGLLCRMWLGRRALRLTVLYGLWPTLSCGLFGDWCHAHPEGRMAVSRV